VSRRRLLALVGVLGLGAFALLGGEYSTFDWLTLRRQLRAEQAAVRDLEAEVDSLERVLREFERSAADQERVAREDFGMIRDGEILYRLVPRQP
jgi:cell division protein FtsB